MIPNKRGFTLIELMVVLTIIGILAGLGVPMLQKQLFKGHLEEAKPYLMAIASRMRTYYKERGTYAFNAYTSPYKEQVLREQLGVDLKDAGSFCFTVTARDPQAPPATAPTPYAFTNDVTTTEFEVWAILRDATTLNPSSTLGAITCNPEVGNKNDPEDWSKGHAGKTIVLRYPPGNNAMQVSGADILHDWVNGISVYDAIKD